MLLDPREGRVFEVHLDVRPVLEPERSGALVGAVAEEGSRRKDVALLGSPSGDPLQLPELLERIDSHVRVRPDAERDAALLDSLDREKAVAEAGVLDCLELVEVNPIRDHENTTASLAVGLAASALGVRIL